MQDIRPEGQTSQTGYVHARCKNHPTLIWSLKDPRTAHLRISQNPQIHMHADTSRPDAMVWPDYSNVPESIRSDPKWIVECPCPGSDLVIFEDAT
jgi:hypothetical protein